MCVSFVRIHSQPQPLQQEEEHRSSSSRDTRAAITIQNAQSSNEARAEACAVPATCAESEVDVKVTEREKRRSEPQVPRIHGPAEDSNGFSGGDNGGSLGTGSIFKARLNPSQLLKAGGEAKTPPAPQTTLMQRVFGGHKTAQHVVEPNEAPGVLNVEEDDAAGVFHAGREDDVCPDIDAGKTTVSLSRQQISDTGFSGNQTEDMKTGDWERFASERTKAIAREVDRALQSRSQYVDIAVSPSLQLVLQWLDSNALGQYKEMFALNQIDERELLQITESDLKEMGMTNAANRQFLLQQTRLLKGAISSSKPKKPLTPAPPCVWIGNHTGMVGKIHELLTRLSRHVNIHGFITYQLTGCSEGWRRGYAVVQGSILHIFKSTLHVVGSPVLSWELFCSTCSPSSAAQHCLSIRKMSDLSLERKTKINEGATSSFKELLIVGYSDIYISQWRMRLMAAATLAGGSYGHPSVTADSSAISAPAALSSSFSYESFTTCVSFESFTLVHPPSSWATGADVGLVVTLKNAEGSAVFQYPPIVWPIVASDGGLAVSGYAHDSWADETSDDGGREASVITVGRALMQLAGHNAFLLVEFRNLKRGAASAGEDKVGLSVRDKEGEGLYWSVVDIKAPALEGQLHQTVQLFKRYLIARRPPMTVSIVWS